MSDTPKTVGEVMTRDVVTVLEEQNLEFIDQGMKFLGFRHLPVVDGDKLVGLVTQRDLLRFAVGAMEPGREMREARYEQNVFVAQVMNRDVETVTPDTPLVDAARLLRQHKHGCLPVVEGDKLVGIITESDFLDLAIKLLSDA
jgi:CBS domain-containing membrane protein